MIPNKSSTYHLAPKYLSPNAPKDKSIDTMCLVGTTGLVLSTNGQSNLGLVLWGHGGLVFVATPRKVVVIVPPTKGIICRLRLALQMFGFSKYQSRLKQFRNLPYSPIIFLVEIELRSYD